MPETNPKWRLMPSLPDELCIVTYIFRLSHFHVAINIWYTDPITSTYPFHYRHIHYIMAAANWSWTIWLCTYCYSSMCLENEVTYTCFKSITHSHFLRSMLWTKFQTASFSFCKLGSACRQRSRQEGMWMNNGRLTGAELGPSGVQQDL